MSTFTIAIPSKGVCDTAFAVQLRLLETAGIDKLQTIYVPGADIACARNALVEGAIGDYILFLDDDTIPPINVITKLLSHKKDIVSALYFAKQEPHFPQIFLENKEHKGRFDSIGEYAKDKLIEVDACGAGCLLIKREVFKKLKKPYFQFTPRGEDTPRIGEDFYFCKKAKEVGYKIYCDTSIICGHLGTKIITSDHWDMSLSMLKELKETMGEDKFNEWKKRFYE